MDDELGNYCQSGKTVRIMGMEEDTATTYGTSAILCTYVSSYNKCDKLHACNQELKEHYVNLYAYWMNLH